MDTGFKVARHDLKLNIVFAWTRALLEDDTMDLSWDDSQEHITDISHACEVGERAIAQPPLKI